MNDGFRGFPLGSLNAPSSGLLQPIFESPDTGVLALNTNYTWVHNLGFRPKLFVVGLRCITTDGNYTAGNEIIDAYLVSTGGVSPLVGFATPTLIGFYGVDTSYGVPTGTFAANLILTVTSWRPFGRVFG